MPIDFLKDTKNVWQAFGVIALFSIMILINVLIVSIVVQTVFLHLIFINGFNKLIALIMSIVIAVFVSTYIAYQHKIIQYILKGVLQI